MKIPWHLIVSHRKIEKSSSASSVTLKNISVFYEVFMTAQQRLIETWGRFFSVSGGENVISQNRQYQIESFLFSYFVCVSFRFSFLHALTFYIHCRVLLRAKKVITFFWCDESPITIWIIITLHIFWLCAFNSFDKIKYIFFWHHCVSLILSKR